MSRLRLTRSEEDYLDYLDLYMRDVHGIIANDIGDIPFSLCIPNRFPCLSSMNVSTNAANGMYMTLVICNKNQAKRLVYPQTNTNKYVTGFHLLKEGHVETDAKKYMRAMLGSYRVGNNSEEQKYNLVVATEEVKRIGEYGHNALITHRLYNINPTTVVLNFYLVDRRDATNLIYYGKPHNPRPRSVVKRKKRFDVLWNGLQRSLREPENV